MEAGKLAAFNDAIFIDASGLGLGKIKFQGIAGLLGANIGEIYDPVEEAATAADPEEETSEEETANGGAAYSVSLGIDLAENYVGLNIDRSLIQMVFGLLTPTLESAGIGGLPDVQSLGLGLTFGDRGISSIALDAVVDGAGTGLHLTLGDFNIALENQLDTKNLVNMVKTQFAGVTYSGTAGVKTLLQSLIDGIDPNLSINVDRRAYSVVLDTSGDTYFGVGRDLKSVRTTTNSSLSIVSSYGYQQAGGNGMEQLGGLTTLNDYAIRLDLAANHPDASQDKALTAKVYFGNNNLMIADVDVGLGWASGLADLLKVFNWINLGTLIGGGQLFPSFAYGDDRDAATWQPGDPVATTASEGEAGVAADDTVLYGNGLKTNGDGSIVTDNDTLDKNAFTTRGSAATNVNGPYKWAISDDGTSWTSGYSYGGGDIMSILNGLVNRVEVNLFNKNGYQPYLATMPDHSGEGVADTDSSLISVKVELNKDAYNELMIFLYTTILSLLHVAIDANGAMTWTIDGKNLSTGVAEHEGGKEFYYFAYDTNWMMGGSGEDEFGNIIRRHENSSGNSKWVMSNLFAELDSIDYMNISEHEKTVRRVQLLEPYARAIPSALLNWVLRDMFHLSAFLAGLLGDARKGLGDATALVSSLLPTFASYDSDAPNPSLNIYIDLNPSESFYGFNDGRTIAPGIQAIELMVNVEKDGGQRLLAGINDNGDPINRQNLFNTSSVANGTLKEAYVLSINPRNLVASDAGYSGEGLFELLQADRLETNIDTNGYKIVVDDVGTKHATIYDGSGKSLAEGTLNADFLVGESGVGAALPKEASVHLVNQDTQTHTVPVSWDAGAIDYTPADEDTMVSGEGGRLAGYVYGYALNLVVGKIPVYITDNQKFAKAVDATTNDSGDDITVVMYGDSAKYELPDLVRVYFGGGYDYSNSVLFGTRYYDAAGNAGLALLWDDTINDYRKNSDGLYNVYPAYVGLMDFKDGAPVTVTKSGVDYYVIKTSNGANYLPDGVFEWDLSYFDYGWDGESSYEDGGQVTVGIRYQWGFAAEQYAEIPVTIQTARLGAQEQSNYQFSNGRSLDFSDWEALATAIGATGPVDLNELGGFIERYFEAFGPVSGNFVNGDGTPNYNNTLSDGEIVAWDLTALKDALVNNVGEEVAVPVTMYVGGFNIWRQYETSALGELSLVHGMMDDVAIYYTDPESSEASWVIASSQEHHSVIASEIASKGYASVAQAVTLTVTIGENREFEWDVASEEPPVTTGADTYLFSDDSATVLSGGVQTYTISTAEQLYGAMPESGSVLDGGTGKTRKAAFDWNGFVFDTDRTADVATLTVTSKGVSTETEVLVTLADNADVEEALATLNDAKQASQVDKIVSARYRALSIDPLEYATFGDYLAGNGLVGAKIEVVVGQDQKIVTVTSWSDTLTDDSVLSLAGARYPENIVTMQDDEGNVYTAVVPVIVNARTIESTEIRFSEAEGNEFAFAGSTRRFSNTVRRYNGPGQVVEVAYSSDTALPTEITVYNAYRFADANPFETDEKGNILIDVTFAEGGEVKEYAFAIAGLVVPESADSATELSLTYELLYESGEGAALRGSIAVNFMTVRVNGNNLDSAIAYGDLGGTEEGVVMFAPYDNMYARTEDGYEQEPMPVLYGERATHGTLLSEFNYTEEVVIEPAPDDDPDAEPVTETVTHRVGDITIYIDSMFVLRSSADNYTSVPAGADVARYTMLADRSYDRVGNSYVLAEGTSGDYVFVYGASYTLAGEELTWDHSSVSYNYNGGLKRTSVSVKHVASEDGAESTVTGTVTLPIYIESGRVQSVAFENKDAEGKFDYSVYFREDNAAGLDYFKANWDGSVLSFDPFDGLDVDKVVEVLGEDGKTVAEQYYLYFPEKVDFITASGAIVRQSAVTWSNLAAIRNTYRGGSFGARFTVPAITGTDANGATVTHMAQQGFTAERMVRIEERRVVEGGTDTQNFGLQVEATTGNGAPFVTRGNPLAVGWRDRPGNGLGNFIDPYSFDLSAFREEAEKITAVKVMITGYTGAGTTDGSVIFYKAGTEKAKETGFSFVWSYTSMSVTYLGGRVALVAQLTGPDGSTQNYEVDYVVERKLVSRINATKGGSFSSYINTTVGADLGTALSTYTIYPYQPSTHKMPTGWGLTVDVYQPTLNVATGQVTFGERVRQDTPSMAYVSVIMPSTAAVTVANATSGLENAGNATMQVTGGQRIRIPVRIQATAYDNSQSVSTPGATAQGKLGDVLVVWYGTATVSYNNGQSTATYNVTLTNPTGGNIEVPSIPGRSVSYKLRAYIGAVVDASGKVIDKNADGSPKAQFIASGVFTVNR